MRTDSIGAAGVNLMTKNKSLGLSALFLSIAVLVSTSLVLALHQSYAAGGQTPTLTGALHLLQKA
jgi:hypothetical protein